MEAMSDPIRRGPGNPNFITGAPSANPHGRLSKAERDAMHLAKMRELASRFGGREVLDPIERERLELAAQLLIKARTPRSQADMVRLTNSADRLIARVENSQRAKNPRRRGASSDAAGFAAALANRGGPK